MRIGFAFFALLCACDSAAQVGSERGRCYGNGTCDEGLACLSDLCVRLTDAGLASDASGSDSGTPDACHELDAEIPPDAEPIVCSNDSSIEPNDDLSTAWTTPIPASMTSVSLAQLAICPTSDEDLFRFGVETNGKNVRATVTIVVASGLLAVRVLNGAGAVIANGQATSGTQIVVAVNNMAVGTYYVAVSAASAGIENNYALDIVTCDGAPCL